MGMNPEVKAEWVKRLREPGRKQITGMLEKPNGGQCCLGVLCEIAAEQGIVMRSVVEFSPFAPDLALVLYDGKRRAMPSSMAVWAGLPIKYHDETEPPRSRDGRDVVTLNDVSLMSFSEIADIIERDA